MKRKVTVHKASGVNRPVCDGNGRMKWPRMTGVVREVTCARCLRMMAAGIARAAAAAKQEAAVNTEFSNRCLVITEGERS